MWDVKERGFLPSDDPIAFLPINDIRATELIHTWENLSSMVPHYLKEEIVREELIYDLRKATHGYFHGCIDGMGGADTHERTFLLLAYFATAYLNSPEGKKKSKLPKEIVIPFARVAHLVGRYPVLDYTSYVLYNWKNHNDIEILQTFTDSPYEQNILAALVKMESLGLDLIRHMSNPFYVAEKLEKINGIFKKVWDNTPDEFLLYLGGILTDYGKLKYETWRWEGVFPCDIFLQSPLLAMLYKYLDIHFENEYLRKRNEDVCASQIPYSHRTFIASISNIRNRCAKQDCYREAYNYCLSELIALRQNLLFRKSDVEIGLIATEELSNYYL